MMKFVRPLYVWLCLLQLINFLEKERQTFTIVVEDSREIVSHYRFHSNF